MCIQEWLEEPCVSDQSLRWETGVACNHQRDVSGHSGAMVMQSGQGIPSLTLSVKVPTHYQTQSYN